MILLCVALCFLTSCGSPSSSGTSSSRSAATTGESEAVGSTGIASSVSAMGPGDLYVTDLSATATTLDLSGGASGAEYLLLIQSTLTNGGSLTASVADESLPVLTAAKSVGVDGAMDIQERFDAFLRDTERDLPVDPAAAASVSPSKSVAKSVQVGQSASFRVLASLYSTSAYRTVSATVKCVNEHVAVYLDDDVPNALTSDQLLTLCSQYESALSAEFAILGDPPDMNGDGVITVLLTKAVNQLGGSGGGIVTGFFFAGDLMTQSSSNPASNQQEIVFALVPDELGTYGTAIPTDFALQNLLSAVIPHEVQHLLSYHYHVLENDGVAEATWLNEAMSHLIEDVVGYGQENPSRIELFLAETQSAGLIPTSSPDLAERGAGYLFLRFLYEQAGNGNGFLRDLLQTPQNGVTNVESAFAGSSTSFDEWSEFIFRWGVAVAVTDADVTTDSRYVYEGRSYNSTTSHYEGVCLICETEDGRGTILTGVTALPTGSSGNVSISASAGAYYDLSTPPASVTIQGNSEDALRAVLIRTQ